MDIKTLERAHELRDKMKRCKEAMDAWEKAEEPLVPHELPLGGKRDGDLPAPSKASIASLQRFILSRSELPLGGKQDGDLPAPSKDAWQVYRRGAIKDLELAHDKAKAEFDKL